MTLTLTPAQINTLRRRTGATTTDLSDDEINALYIDTSLGNLDLSNTTYYVITELLGAASLLVSKSNEVDNLSIQSSEVFDHLEKLLAYWGGVTGLGSGLTFTQTNVNTYRADSRQTTEPTYPITTLEDDWPTP